MTSVKSHDVIFCLRLPYPLKFRTYSWTDLAKVWLKGQSLSVYFKSDVIFYFRGQYQADIGHFLQFLIIGLLWQQLK